MTVAADRAVTLSPRISQVLVAGLAGGAVDFVYASVLSEVRGRGIMKVWQSVASGWIGKAAGDGGWATASLGIVTHFGIATVMAAVYALAATRLPVLYRRPLLCGFFYGFVLYAVMYGIVLPTRFGRAYHWNGVISVLDICAHIGVAIAAAWVLSRGRRA